jgi:hypothetical protein
MSPVPGWYADPSDAARLRWWDGSTWTDHTRENQPRTAPPPPGPAATGQSSANPGYGTPDPGYGSQTYANPGYGNPNTGYGAPATPPAAEPARAWLSWASIGAAIAVALAVIIVLSISVLGHDSKPSASQGLAPTSGGSAASTTSTAPPTTVVPPPPDSTLFNDPAGVYSISVNSAWQPPAAPVGGIQVWYLTGVNYGGYRSNLRVVTQQVPAGTTLAQYAQILATQMRGVGAQIHGTTDVTLADGTPAVVISYSAVVYGQQTEGESLETLKGTQAVVLAVSAGTDGAAITFAQVDPYVKSLHLN